MQSSTMMIVCTNSMLNSYHRVKVVILGTVSVPLLPSPSLCDFFFFVAGGGGRQALSLPSPQQTKEEEAGEYEKGGRRKERRITK